MNAIPESISKNRRLLQSILDIAAKKKISLYLVGGILRDSFLNREKENPDIDFCLKRGAIALARETAGVLRAGFVVLDEEHGCGRVVKQIGRQVYTFDFTDFRGKDLEDDLLHRDFTVNSMAMELGALLRANKPSVGPLIDPWGGRRDIRSRTIRLVHKSGFDEDPLRILRAFSFAALLGFRIEDKTLKLARAKRGKIVSVSWERIRDELFKILSTQRTHDFLLRLDKNGILELLFPEIAPMRAMKQGKYHSLDVWGHTMETVRHLELCMKSFGKRPEIGAYLDEEISSGRRRRELLKLAALLHDIGKPETLRVEKGKVQFHGHERVGSQMFRGIGARMKLANEEVRFVRQIIFMHLRPGYLVTNPVVTPRAKFRFFRDAGMEAASILLLSLADQRSTRGYPTLERSRGRHERTGRALIREYFYKQKEVNPGRLVNGHDIIKEFGLQPSPEIGKILRDLEELQAIGKVRTKA
ncbi:MAG: HD domain-containing protein, partial [Candidatus Omnitrophica bacterium]|nr:HD domain-containing protein [Candidatus Omnitrophota bacterium]